jgi:hypothetical protein
MHDISPEEQEEVEASVAAAIEEKEQEGDDGEVVDAEGNVQEGNDGDSEVADQEAGAVDTDFGKEA